MRNLLLLLVAIVLTGCARKPSHPSALQEQDESIVFPESFGPTPMVGRPGKPYALDGATLQALWIATNDFLPPETKETPCWERRDSFVYQVLRQAEVIFIEVHADPAACQGEFLMLDSGWRYAISVDGRILRRLQTGEPTGSVMDAGLSDAGMGEGLSELDVSSVVEGPQGSPLPGVPWRRMDGGAGLMAQVPPLSSAVDGGSPGDGGAPESPR